MLLSIGCEFDDMGKKTISRGTGEECLEGIIRRMKDLIAQVDIKIEDARGRASYDGANRKQRLRNREVSKPTILMRKQKMSEIRI